MKSTAFRLKSSWLARRLSRASFALLLGLCAVGSAHAVSDPVTTQVVAGSTFSCVLTTAGAVKCFGANNLGQLGDGTTTASLTPVTVSGLGSGVIAISAGQNYACALTDAGGVKCWGDNSFGKLGDGTTTQSSTPVDVVGLTSGVSAIRAAQTHTCALTDAGALKCWGYNQYGQLGDGTTTDSSAPVDVAGLGGAINAIAVGGFHTCAVTSAGATKCWGRNQFGQLGDSTTTDSTAPVDVTGLASGVQNISAGNSHSCALTSTGALKCWGSNANGQLGDGTTTDSGSPVDVVGLGSGVAASSAAGFHSCALTTTGGVKCWGQNNGGQLGDGSTTDRSTPVDVTSLTSGAIAVSASDPLHSCALTELGVGKCWGFNGNGELGDGTTTSSNVAVDIAGVNTGGTLQSIALTAAAAQIPFGGTMQLTATASSTLPVAFDSLTPLACSVASTGVVTGLLLQTCVIRAQQSGDATFAQAPWQVRSFTVTQGDQTISFGALASKRINDAPFTVSATGGASGNPVTFASQTPAVCTVAGNTVTLVTTGTCTVRASQAGNANYNAAADVDQSFTVRNRGGGGGCALNPGSGSDASLALLALLALGWNLRRSARRN